MTTETQAQTNKQIDLYAHATRLLDSILTLEPTREDSITHARECTLDLIALLAPATFPYDLTPSTDGIALWRAIKSAARVYGQIAPYHADMILAELERTDAPIRDYREIDAALFRASQATAPTETERALSVLVACYPNHCSTNPAIYASSEAWQALRNVADSVFSLFAQAPSISPFGGTVAELALITAEVAAYVAGSQPNADLTLRFLARRLATQLVPVAKVNALWADERIACSLGRTADRPSVRSVNHNLDTIRTYHQLANLAS